MLLRLFVRNNESFRYCKELWNLLLLVLILFYSRSPILFFCLKFMVWYVCISKSYSFKFVIVFAAGKQRPYELPDVYRVFVTQFTHVISNLWNHVGKYAYNKHWKTAVYLSLKDVENSILSAILFCIDSHTFATHGDA